MNKPTEAEFRSAPSETARYRHICTPLCEGCGVDIASQGDAVVPWAISFDLPKDEFDAYCGGAPAKGPIHLRGHADKLPFESDSLDWVYASHLIEDFQLAEWASLIGEWARCIRPGGHIIILCPEKNRWQAHLASGGMPNCAHQHEAELGDFAAVAKTLGLGLVMEGLTEVYPWDYSVLAVLAKL